MKIAALSTDSGSRPVVLDLAHYVALRELLACANSEVGPTLKVSTFLGSGETGGGAYAGHAELYDVDGVLRESYGQPSLEPGVNDTLFGGGKGFDLASTTMSTIGEAVERSIAALVSCSPHLPARRLLGTWHEMCTSGHPAIDPTTVGLFSDAQHARQGFLYAPFTADTRIQWIEARRAISGDPVWIPSQLVDMVHIYDPGEEIIGYPVSGGLSCHSDAESALFHGITEVIERDAVNRTWYTASTPLQVAVDVCPDPRLARFFDTLALNGGDTSLLLHESPVCDAFTFSVIGLQTWLRRRRLCAGGGCDTSLLAALHKAAAEYGQTRGTIALSVSNPRSAVGRSVEAMFDWDTDRSMHEMTLFFQAIGYYGLPEHAECLEHYRSGDQIALSDLLHDGHFPPAAPVPERLRELLAQLGSAGVDPIVLDYSHPDWRRLRILKVWIPELSTPFLQSRPMLGHPVLADLRPELHLADGSIMPLPYP